MHPSSSNFQKMRKSQSKRTQSDMNRFRKAVEKSGEVIFLTDREGIITYINPEFSRLYGYSSEEIVGKTTPRILKSGSMTHQDYERFWETLLEGQVVRGEFINKCKDGSFVTVEGSANPILDENEDVIGFLAIQRDITERKLVKEKLEAAHSFQQSIIDGLADPILVIGADYQVLMANRTAQEFATGGVALDEPIYCYQMSHHREVPCDGTSHPCPLHEVEETGQPVNVIHEHYQANGERRFVEIAAAPFRNASGSFQGIIESMRDITEHKQAEQDLIQYTERLRAISAQLAEVEDLERQRLARELHDQVGQNLTALGINLNIIQMQMPENVSTSVNYHLEDSLSLVEQTAERIRDVMADLRPPVLDDYGLVAALRWYGEKIARRIEISIEVEGEEPSPRLDSHIENALFRIVQEALTNVTKHAQASYVKISVGEERDILRLTIVDDGIGFDPEGIIQPDSGQGWGLLSITERAEAVGGQCRIASSPNQGTRVIVELPR
jgi:two-component system sensor histidine kinase UhpB